MIFVLIIICRNQWIEVGKTEVINDSLNPKFIKNFNVEYHFEER